MSADRWWDKFRDGPDPDLVEPTPIGEPVACAREDCSWSGTTDRLIDHPKIEYLLCPHCLRSMPGTYRRLTVTHCPNCDSVRMTPDGRECLECPWPEIEIQSEPTTENPEDLE